LSRSVRCSKWLAHRQGKDLYVLAEGSNGKVAEFGELTAQFAGKLDAPSALKIPDFFARLQSIRSHQPLPLTHEILRRKHPGSLVIGGDDPVPTAGKTFESGNRIVEGNWLLPAEIVSQDQIGLVVDKDHRRWRNILPHEFHGSGHLLAALIRTVHAWRPGFAEDEAECQDEHCECNPSRPAPSCQTCQRHADAGHCRDDQECDLPRAPVGIKVGETESASDRKRQNKQRGYPTAGIL